MGSCISANDDSIAAAMAKATSDDLPPPPSALSIAAANPTADLLPPLFALPPALLVGSILGHLTPAEVVRTLALTTKRPAAAALWTHVLAQRLARFTPAKAWYAVQNETAASPHPMRDVFVYNIEVAERRLAGLLKAAGVEGAEWAWIGPRTARRLALLPASMAKGMTARGFGAWAAAFACKECHKPGAVTNQCVSCGQPLCSDCKRGCTEAGPVGVHDPCMRDE